MKSTMILAMFFFVSCASYAPKTYKQNCAQKGMVLVGVTEASSSTSFYNFNTNSTAYADSSGEAVSCIVPKNEVEKCEIEVENKVAAPINEYNKTIGTKRILNGAAYGLFIVPGILSKFYYDGVREKAIVESNEIRDSFQDYCSDSARQPANFKDKNPGGPLSQVEKILNDK